MKKKMIKVLWVFLIFALTSNTKGFASAIDRSFFIASFPISDCHSVPDTESSLQSKEYYFPTQNISCVIPLKIRGTKGRYEFALRFVTPRPVPRMSTPPLNLRGVLECASYVPPDKGDKGGYDFSVIPAHAGIQSNSPLTRGAGCVSSFHPAKKLSTSGSAIPDTGSSSLTLNCVSIDPIQQSKITSNNLSDIFIPPKITV